MPCRELNPFWPFVSYGQTHCAHVRERLFFWFPTSKIIILWHNMHKDSLRIFIEAMRECVLLCDVSDPAYHDDRKDNADNNLKNRQLIYIYHYFKHWLIMIAVAASKSIAGEMVSVVDRVGRFLRFSRSPIFFLPTLFTFQPSLSYNSYLSPVKACYLMLKQWS